MQALHIVVCALSWRLRMRTLLDSYLHARHEELLQARDGGVGGKHCLLKAERVWLGGRVGRQLGRHDGVELGAGQGEAREDRPFFRCLAVRQSKLTDRRFSPL